MSAPKYEWDVRDDWTPALINEEIEAYEATSGNDLDWRRYEVLDGILIVTPPRPLWHAHATTQLWVALHEHAPRGYLGFGAAIIDLHPSYPITDGIVVSDRIMAQDDMVVAPKDVLLAVEVEWPRSLTADRIVKPYQYATAGILHYWRIETDPFRLHAYRLSDGDYVEVGTWEDGDLVSITDPFPIKFDLADLRW